MKKYIHHDGFVASAVCLLSDSPNETARGYTLYAEIEADNLPVILQQLQEAFAFKIEGENVDTSALCFVNFLRGLPDNESTIKEPFRLIRHMNGFKTELCYKIIE